MKRTYTLIICLICALAAGYAQKATFSSHTVATDFDGPAGIHLADMDNNGFLDVLCAGADAHTIACWMNSGDSPPSWTQRIVDDDFVGAIYVSSGDIDGDGNLDVLGAAWQDHELAWWRNEDGQFSKYVIREGFTQAHEVMACDMDQDGDLDVLGVSAALNRISWFENDGSFPVNWTEHTIGLNFMGARSVDAADVDGDGDVDLVGAALQDHKISWWRNDGGDPQSWTEITIVGGFTYAHKVHCVDMDADGDIDVLGTAFSNGISWWENDGADSTGWTRHHVAGFASAVIGYAVDLDADEDMDIVCSAQTVYGKIGLWFSDGVYPFSWEYDILENDLPESWPLHYGDMDNDGDTDIVCGGNEANEIRWYQNDLITSLPQPVAKGRDDRMMSCYPTPAKGDVTIRIQLNTDQNVHLGVYDLTGRLIRVITDDYLQEGVYKYHWTFPDNEQQLFFARLRTGAAMESLRLVTTR